MTRRYSSIYSVRSWSVLLTGVSMLPACSPNLAALSAGHVGCSPNEVTVTDEAPIGFNGMSWTAWCNGERYACPGAGHMMSCRVVDRGP
jgi:hypothetical protein